MLPKLVPECRTPIANPRVPFADTARGLEAAANTRAEVKRMVSSGLRKNVLGGD